MFCDLVGSTNLREARRRGEAQLLVNAYLDEATKAVTGLGGHVLKRLGDGLMALFGYPPRRKTMPSTAVRAALAIQPASRWGYSSNPPGAGRGLCRAHRS